MFFARIMLGLLPLFGAVALASGQGAPQASTLHGVQLCNLSQKITPAIVSLKIQPAPENLSDDASTPTPSERRLWSWFYSWFEGEPTEPLRQTSLYEAGVLVSHDGYILTNHHILKDGGGVTAILSTGQVWEARVIGTDPYTDLAVLKIDAPDLPYLSFACSEEIQLGEWVIAVGRHGGAESVMLGVLSYIGMQNGTVEDLQDLIQKNASTNPGSSGPLINWDGQILGISTILTHPRPGGSVTCVAIPSEIVQHVMHQILAKETSSQDQVNTSLQPLSPALCEALLDSVLIASMY